MTSLRITVLAVAGLCLVSFGAVPARAQCCGPNGLTGCSNADPSFCCSGLCQGDTCVACLGLGATCSTDGQCCSSFCQGQSHTCDCFFNGDGCRFGPQSCCSGFCTPDGLCCAPLSAGCNDDSECCSGHCQGNVCTCGGSGQACTSDIQCCTPNTCGGGGTAGICGCTSQSRQEACGNQVCGSVIDNCGRTVVCGSCGAGRKCCGDSCIPASQQCM
jgi:hypothetical protein